MDYRRSQIVGEIEQIDEFSDLTNEMAKYLIDRLDGEDGNIDTITEGKNFVSLEKSPVSKTISVGMGSILNTEKFLGCCVEIVAVAIGEKSIHVRSLVRDWDKTPKRSGEARYSNHINAWISQEVLSHWGFKI